MSSCAEDVRNHRPWGALTPSRKGSKHWRYMARVNHPLGSPLKLWIHYYQYGMFLGIFVLHLRDSFHDCR